MSGLDQAFIKAYAKDGSSQESRSSLPGPHFHSRSPAPSAPENVSEMYADGAYYRVDKPANVGRSEPAAASNPPAPHLPAVNLGANRSEASGSETGGSSMTAMDAAAELKELITSESVIAPQVTSVHWQFVDPGSAQVAAPAEPVSAPAVQMPTASAPAVESPANEPPATDWQVTQSAAEAAPVTDRAAAEPDKPSHKPEASAQTQTRASNETTPAEEAPTEETPTETPAFVPEWEVDDFLWPEMCDQLLKDQAEFFADAGENLRTATAEGVRILAVAGSRRGEGRSTLALCLARCASRADVRVALVDADFDHPDLADLLGVEVDQGWNEGVPLSEAAVLSINDHVTLFPVVDHTAPDARQAANIVQQIAQHVDLVIVDLPPVDLKKSILGAGDPSLFDTAIVVQDTRNTSRQETLATASHLHKSGVDKVGVAENFTA